MQGWHSRVGWLGRTQPIPTRVGSDPQIRPTPMESGRSWIGQTPFPDRLAVPEPCSVLKLQKNPPPPLGRPCAFYREWRETPSRSFEDPSRASGERQRECERGAVGREEAYDLLLLSSSSLGQQRAEEAAMAVA
ncbi:hypothetical protein Taro_054338 [Colocasia esculenta]|uniref:Uncharacterized protein n=1 Tax=Colocasia esculenta TaxID=4460 RepID=A0A843XQE0_COLES|nr:hypothetical protein [Colocasia esculenta]